MTLEAVVCEDPPEVRVVGEVYSVHVPDFSLVPVSGFENVVDRLDRCELVRVGLHPHAGIKAERQKVVDDLKSIYKRSMLITPTCTCTDLYSLVGTSTPAISTRQPN